jgi:transglutaminase-like putative cysteine protease
MYGSVCASSGIRPVPSEQYVTPKHIRYSFVVRNTTDTVIPTVQLWAYAPVPQTSHQWVEQIIASHPFTTSRDTVGNEVLAFQFPDFPPYAISVVHITVALKMVHSAQPMFEPAPERFLQAEPYIEIDDPAMLAAATRLRRESLLASSHTSYAWVSQYVASTAYIPEDRGALYALTHRTGDCTEFAYLLTALHRVNRIPSRVVGGYVVKGNAIIKATEYHNWTEFYHAGAWHIADAQKHHFMPHQIEYVAFRILASDNGGPLYNAHRFRYAGQGLSVLME